MLTKWSGGAKYPKKVLKQWFRIRDLFIGDNGENINIDLAVALAKTCEHEDAKWIASNFSIHDHIVSVRERMNKMVDCRAWTFHHLQRKHGLYFYTLMSHELPGYPTSMDCLKEAADAGYPFAIARYYTSREEMLKIAVRDGDEPDAHYFLAELYMEKKRHIVEHEHCLAEYIDAYATYCNRIARLSALIRHHFKQAAKLGHAEACAKMAKLYPSDCVKWMCKFAHNTNRSRSFLELHLDDLSILSNVDAYLVGKCIKNNISTSYDVRVSRVCFGIRLTEKQGQTARACIEMYTKTIRVAILAIDCWSMCARRLDMVKDIRILIARLVWKKRILYAAIK